jgi:hypothetical protein
VRESQAAVHFLLTKETGINKIRDCFVLIVESLHDFYIGLSSPICWHESPKGADGCRDRSRILLVCQAPAFRNMCCRCVVLVIMQVFHDLWGATGETIYNGRRQILQGADILDPQNELSEGEFFGEWILFGDFVETVDKYV